MAELGNNKLRPIKSFVKRSGRLSPAQETALENLLPKYTVNDDFIAKQPLQMEIGFGNGEALIITAQANPNINFIGLEVHNPGVGHLLLKLEQSNLLNIKIFHGDAWDFLTSKITANSIDKIMLFFPDPWHKKRHHKRRIIRAEFITEIIRILVVDGIFHMATDSQNYADFTVNTINKYSQLKNSSPSNNFISRPNCRPVTKFELRGQKLGHKIWDMVWVKTSN